MVFIFVVLFSLIFEIGAIFLEVQLKQTILSHYLNYVYDLEPLTSVKLLHRITYCLYKTYVLDKVIPT